MTDLINADLVRLDADLGSDKDAVIRALARIVGDGGRATDVDQLVEDAFAREAKSATGLPGGIAIPHCRTAGVAEPVLAFARLAPKVDFGAKDGPADIVFLIAAPAGGDNTHLQLLTKLARALVKPAFTDSLRDAETPEEVAELVTDVVGAAPAGPRAGRRRPGRCARSGAAWSRSPPARPASRTPTWPPRPSRPPPSAPGSTSRSRPRARPAPSRSLPRSSPQPRR